MKYFIYAATISTLAIVSATSAKAYDEVEASDAEGETIIVTAERVARANNVVEKAIIEALSGGENIVNAIRRGTCRLTFVLFSKTFCPVLSSSSCATSEIGCCRALHSCLTPEPAGFMPPGRVRNRRRQTLRVAQALANCCPRSDAREDRPRRGPSLRHHKAWASNRSPRFWPSLPG